jgi:ribosomal-protein-serine acetyltransferase
MTLVVSHDIVLILSHEKYANQFFEVIDENREHLAKFLPWVPFMKSNIETAQYLQQCQQLNSQNKEYSFLIFFKTELVGRIGIHYIDNQNKIGSIGYWLAQNAVGKGIITKACKKIIEFGFKDLHLNRIEIKAATNNTKSQAIPQKLNFTLEGILMQAELVNGEFLDLNLYAMVKKHWVNNEN